jgi:hypothetical protein
MKNNHLQQLFLITMLFPISLKTMEKSEKQNFQSAESISQRFFKNFPHPSKLIDPKTNLPYRQPSQAWDAFWDIAYVWCQKKETQRVQKYLADKKMIDEYKNELRLRSRQSSGSN